MDDKQTFKKITAQSMLEKSRQGLTALAEESKRLKDLISTAKTTVKTEYYKKKLKKNNELLMRELVVANKLEEISS